MTTAENILPQVKDFNGVSLRPYHKRRPATPLICAAELGAFETDIYDDLKDGYIQSPEKSRTFLFLQRKIQNFSSRTTKRGVERGLRDLARAAKAAEVIIRRCYTDAGQKNPFAASKSECAEINHKENKETAESLNHRFGHIMTALLNFNQQPTRRT